MEQTGAGNCLILVSIDDDNPVFAHTQHIFEEDRISFVCFMFLIRNSKIKGSFLTFSAGYLLENPMPKMSNKFCIINSSSTICF